MAGFLSASRRAFKETLSRIRTRKTRRNLSIDSSLATTCPSGMAFSSDGESDDDATPYMGERDSVHGYVESSGDDDSDQDLLSKIDADLVILVDDEESSESRGKVIRCESMSPPAIPVRIKVNVSESSLPSPIETSQNDGRDFFLLRVTYLIVTLVIMLSDGLQGTHLYVLYEGYGFSVSTLYCMGFLSGALMSPLTGPLIDIMGRKKAAMLYCLLEMFINFLEQFPFLSGLIVARMIGGFTTNLLSQVFETWLDTEYRRRGFCKEKYETIMRDAVIVSNLAAIFSGYLAHILADRYGPVGPFRGAVTCTTIALFVVMSVWTENYGGTDRSIDSKQSPGMVDFLLQAIKEFAQDSKMLRVGIIQGLTAGSLQLFVFLWTPTLRHFAQSAPLGGLGLDHQGEPAYGLIFGTYMAAGVLGGLVAPRLRQSVMQLLSTSDSFETTVDLDGEGIVPVRPMAVEFLASCCYAFSAALLFIPCILSDGTVHSFSISLSSFLLYELLIGIMLPCEGVIRSLYFPTQARASIMTLPRIIVNVAVSIGVMSTSYISLKKSFGAVAFLMIVASLLQLSLISFRDWSSMLSRIVPLLESRAKRSHSFEQAVLPDSICQNSPQDSPTRLAVGGPSGRSRKTKTE